MATGLSRTEFEDLTPEEIFALSRVVSEGDEIRNRRAANLYALLCNLLGSGKRTWRPEDFLPSEPDGAFEPADAAAGLARYEAEMEATRLAYEAERSRERGEPAGDDVAAAGTPAES